MNLKPFLLIKTKNTLLTLALASLSAGLTAGEKEVATDTADEQVLVTGSRIKKIDLNNLTPILSINREDIDKQGYATVKDVIDGLTQNAGGTMDNSFTFGFTPGASSVNLRGVGFGHTLVLIDGRRLPIYPIGIDGTSNFVDLSAIPMAFVERVDVLTDGASAVYGSDAVSGVINVITRKDIEGISMNLRYGQTSDGGFENYRYNLLTGARNGDTQIDMILDIWSQKALWAQGRDYAASDISNPRGDYSGGGASFYGLFSGNAYQHPDCGTSNDPLGGAGIADVSVNFFSAGEVWCGYDRAPHRQLIAPQEKFSMMTRLTYEISPDLSFFSRIGYSYSQTESQFEANFYGGALFNGFGSLVPNNGGLVMPDAPNNPLVGSPFAEPGVFVRRLVEFGPRVSKVDNNSINLLLGLEGSFGGGSYDWEFGLAYNHTQLDSEDNNILLSGLNAAVESGLDLFQPIPQVMVDRLAYIADRESTSSNRIVDFSLTGDMPFSLAAGPVQFAVSFEHVSEKYKDIPDALVLQGDAFDGQTSGGGSRDHLGIGGELSFPFSDNFEMDLAIRWDDYDDDSSVNSAVSPRIAFGYRPIESLLTRLSWGKSFRAPDMQRLFGGATSSFSDIIDPEFLVDANGNLCSDPQTQNCAPALIQSVSTYVYSNIDLQEEEGQNFSLGLVWEASDKLNVSLDYFKIELEQVVETFSPQTLVDLCSFEDLLCELVHRDAVGSLTGADAFLETTAINFAEQDTSGVDLVISYDWQNTLGAWSSRFNMTWVDEFNTRFSDQGASVENVGLGFLPEYRANLVLDWQKAEWGATARINFVDKVAGAYCFYCDASQFVDAWTTASLNFRYAIGDYSKIRLGINNLTNEAPPQDPTMTTWPWFQQGGGFYSAVGREIYLQLDTRF